MNGGIANLRSTLRHGKSCRGAWAPEYYSWSSMIQRCTNPARNVWHLYGGRGIKVCDRWFVFDAFLSDMGTRPPGSSLGRIDPDGDYCPGNCEWQSDAKQSRSRRNNKLNETDVAAIRAANGESQQSLGRRFGVSKTMIRNIRKGFAWAA